MGTKLEKNTYPASHKAEDFQCYGPPALKDGEFSDVKIADLGCFTQDGKDSNKYYHAAVVKSRKDNSWFVYFEWGRTGAKNPNFQFVQCSGEADAQKEFVSQLRDKNDKRGEWVTLAGNRVLRAKAGKDCYLVRAMATRSTGLPDAKTIKTIDDTKPRPKVESKKGSKPKYDPNTLSLFKDLSLATVQFTRGSMADASLPTQASIEEARLYLQEAQKRLAVVGNDVEDQVADRDLVHLTGMLYGRIPKKKRLHAPAEEWILNMGNILLWQQDLDAFESALYVSTDVEEEVVEDPFNGILQMDWIDPKSDTGRFIYGWWPKATANKHGYIGAMKIKNAWRVERRGDVTQLCVTQEKVRSSAKMVQERPLFQPSERSDLEGDDIGRFKESNTALLFHGTRSVNVTGILRESLRLPKQLVGVVITGAMFGPLIYMADDWKKSAGYTSLSGGYYSSGAGGVKGRNAFMFACDVVCGKAFVAPGPHGYTDAPAGYHSIFGKGGVSQVQNNEWVIPKREQIRIRYLVEFAV